MRDEPDRKVTQAVDRVGRVVERGGGEDLGGVDAGWQVAVEGRQVREGDAVLDAHVGEVGRRRTEPVAEFVGVALRLADRLRAHRGAVGVEQPGTDLRSVALHLDDGDPVVGMHEHGVELVVAAGDEVDVGDDQPAVRQPVAERLHHPTLLVVAQLGQGEVLGYQDAHCCLLLVPVVAVESG